MGRAIETDVIVVGAGIAGLLAATELSERHGRDVLVIEKGRGFGGRMATRRHELSTFDHGAQYFTVREERFRRWVARWKEAGLVKDWYGEQPSEASHPRYVGNEGMNAIGKHLGNTLKVMRQTLICSASFNGESWELIADSRETFHARCLLITAPVPQALAILENGGEELDDTDQEFLGSIRYAKCIAALATLDGPSWLPQPGGLKLDATEPIAWIADNQQKGVSGQPAVTIHSGPAFAEKYFDAPDEIKARHLAAAAAPFLNSEIVDVKVHRWGFAHRTTEHNRPFFTDPKRTLWLAGDGFDSPRVEGAAMSGLAAADSIAQR